MSSITAPTDISAGTPIPTANPCPTIDPSAADLYTCFRKGLETEFNYPTAMDFDAKDNLYIADTGNNAIRKITPDGTVSTFYAKN